MKRERLYGVSIRGKYNFSVNDEMPLSCLRIFLEDKKGHEGFNLSSYRVDEIMSKVMSLNDYGKSIKVKCDCRNFGEDCVVIEIFLTRM